FGADVNILNNSGESSLHLAAYTGREEVVGLLLSHGALTGVINSQNQTPQDITESQHIKELIDAAEKSALLQMHSEFLQAAATGNIDELSKLFSGGISNINAQDNFGNSALHLAAMRGHAVAAALLLQFGINSSLQNNAGQTAFDLAVDVKTRQVLGVQSIKTIISQPQRFEGTLLKKSRFVGFKPMWFVLERGVLSFFLNRGDASTGSKRKGMKYLDEAKVLISTQNSTEMSIEYSDGSRHTKWILALKEHIAYSTHYIHQGEETNETTEEIFSLGTMQDSLQNAQAYERHLEKQIKLLQESLVTLSQHVTENNNKGSNHTGSTVTSGHAASTDTLYELDDPTRRGSPVASKYPNILSALTTKKPIHVGGEDDVELLARSCLMPLCPWVIGATVTSAYHRRAATAPLPTDRQPLRPSPTDRATLRPSLLTDGAATAPLPTDRQPLRPSPTDGQPLRPSLQTGSHCAPPYRQTATAPLPTDRQPLRPSLQTDSHCAPPYRRATVESLLARRCCVGDALIVDNAPLVAAAEVGHGWYLRSTAATHLSLVDIHFSRTLKTS
ncbi:hypothetical protein Btru_010510, partial [Bulinus truncatus]